MVIPGFMILLFITSFLGYKWTINEMAVDSSVFWIITATLSYSLGIVNEVISRKIWAGLRNNINMINAQLKKLKDEIGTSYNLPTHNNKLDAPSNFSYMCKCVLGIITLIGITEMLLDKLIPITDSKQASTLLICFFAMLVAILAGLSILSEYERTAQTKDAKDLLNKYYDCYYKVSSNQYHSGISTIESQVAFLQNISIPIFLFAALPCSKYSSTFVDVTYISDDFWYYRIKGLFILLLVIILYAVYKRIEKIYYLVWSDNEYLKRINR